MIKNLYLSQFRFTLIPEEKIILPRFNKGITLRGAFGSSLKRLVCTADKGITCELCIFKDRCAYVMIFNPTELTGIKRMKNQPRGYVLKPPLSEDMEYTASSPLRFDMILIGDRALYLPYVIVPLMELGRAGIGLNRGRFRLNGIESIKDGSSASIYDPVTNIVKNKSEPITGKELMARADAIRKDSVTLNFLTPTRIKYNPTGKKGGSLVVRSPEFHHIVRRLRDRINAVSSHYCGSPMDIDFKGMAERAMGIKTKSSHLRWLELKRKSKTQNTIHVQSGFIGRITFEGNLKEFLPLILAGEYIHIGEDAVFGNGWYKVK